MRLLAYISGHGYGHSTRLVALLEAVRAEIGDVALALRTQVPPWLFEATLSQPYEHQGAVVDCGVRERGLLWQDWPATLAACREYYGALGHHLATEVAAARAFGPDLIVSDIPPLAAAVGARLGVPNVALGNFSWDYIYAAQEAEAPGLAEIAETCAELYRQTTLLLRLPFCHEMVAFPKQVDIPLIARWPRSEAADTRRAIGLDIHDDRPLVLIVSRHAASGDAMLASLAGSGRYRVVRFGEQTGQPAPGFWLLGPEWQPRFVDVLAACDAVVSKLGYGLVSECLTAQTAVLYPPRFDFAEYPLLEAGLAGQIPHRRLNLDEFESGQLVGPLDELLALPQVYRAPPTDGPACGAAALLAALRR